MKHTFTLLFILLWGSFCRAQNLVPNPSFEDHTQCPNNGGQLDYALYWTNPLIGGGSSPDYMNACGIFAWNVPSNVYGYEYARTGVAYAAICTDTHNPDVQAQNNFREYLQVELLDSLRAGSEYCIDFYVSACDSMHYVSNNIGVYFSLTQISDTVQGYSQVLPFMPQFENDSTNNLNSRIGWTEVTGRYKAQGGEKFILIGNFRDSVTTVATYTGWGLNTSFIHAAYYIDDVSLTLCDTTIDIINDFSMLDLQVYPNPSNGYFCLETKSNCINKAELFDTRGRLVLYEDFLLQKNISINIRDKPSGIYLLSITTSTNKYFFKIIKT